VSNKNIFLAYFIIEYLSFSNNRKILSETPILLAPIIIMSAFMIPYRTHRDRPVIREMISHLETSSVFFVLSDFRIWGTVLHNVKNVANTPTTKTTNSLPSMKHRPFDIRTTTLI
jgi:hypothetical protein